MIEVDLVSHLLEQVTLVDGRVYPLIMPQNDLFPSVVCTVVNNQDKQRLNGLPYGETLRIQLNVYAESYKDVKEVLVAVKSALYAFTHYPYELSSKDGFESETKLHTQQIEFYLKG